MTILEVIIDDRHYAVDTDEVLEYTPYSQPEEIPGSDDAPSAYIEGTVRHAGVTYTVVDMRRYLRSESAQDGFLVYLRQKDPAAALHVDAVTGVYMEAPEGLELLDGEAIVQAALSGESELDKADKKAAEEAEKAKAAAEKAAADQAFREKQASILVENKPLETALANYNKDHSVENLNILVNMILNCRLLLPAGYDAQNRPVPMLLKTKDGLILLPIYTCRDRVVIKPQPRTILNLSYEALNRMGLDKNLKAAGIVINSGHENVVFKHELLEQIDAAYAKRDAMIKQREEQLKAAGDGQVPVDPSQSPDKAVNNSELEAALDAHKASQTEENLKNVLDLIKAAHLFVPGMLDENKQPRLSLIKDKEGRMFIPAFTSKDKVPMQPKPPAVFCVPFADLSRNAAAQKDSINGILLNPGSHGLVLTPAPTAKV
jgi:hypothetical protein